MKLWITSIIGIHRMILRKTFPDAADVGLVNIQKRLRLTIQEIIMELRYKKITKVEHIFLYKYQKGAIYENLNCR